VLTTSLPIEWGALSVGIALQRVWLEAERRALAFQPFAAPALLALSQYEDVPAKTANALRLEWGKLTEETPLMVFRLGHAPRPMVRAKRQPVQHYLSYEQHAPSRS
jgi:hypothetical protein